jgi:uncharacterized protein (TIGR02271 family)
VSSMDIQEGMQVYGPNDQMIGRVESLHGDGFHVAGRHIGRDQVTRVEHNRVYLQGTGAMTGTGSNIATGAAEGEVRVPVVEEQLQVGKREVDLGEVEIRRRVVEEEQSVPVTLRREEVTVEQVGTPTRPLQPGEDAFQEGTIRVPVRGEEAVVAKEAVVTGEVVVEKDVTTDQRQVADTVRRTEVDFDENYDRARTGFQQDFTTRTSAATDDWGRNRTFEQAEPNYRAGFRAGTDQRYSGQEFEALEPQLRRDYESGSWSTAGAATSGTGSTRATTSSKSGTTGGDSWERLREEVRHGFQTARNRTR